jgi:hydrogenase-4 component E
LLNFVALGASQLRTVIHAVALQGVLLGATIVVAHSTVTVWVIVMAGAVISLKGVVIPRMLFHAIREVVIRREVEPIIGFIASLLLGGVGTALAVLFSTTRAKAISQVVGYLVLENGIFIFGLLLVEAMPFLVEIGVLLDLFVAIFVMGIIIYQISQEFSTVSTRKLSALKE